MTSAFNKPANKLIIKLTSIYKPFQLEQLSMSFDTSQENKSRQNLSQFDEIWVFGYGSLIYKVDFPILEKRPASIRGWQRRFWQGSHDHRGTPQSPGRVLTLVEAENAVCAGMAYRVEHDVFEHLDHREKNGYLRYEVEIFFDQGSAIKAGDKTSDNASAGDNARNNMESKRGLVYIGSESSDAYLGPATIEAIAAQIHSSVGPSGRNDDYVFLLANGLRELGEHDEHVFAIEAALKQITTFEPLSQQFLRDLCWIFSSPPLIESGQFSFQQKAIDKGWQRAMAQSGHELNKFMANKNLKMLGPYFEALWEFFLSNYPDKKLIAKNVQVFSANKTIGEFDFIYLDEATGDYCHLEVAIKYFLGLDDRTVLDDRESGTDNTVEKLVAKDNIKNENQTNNCSTMNQWLGPNANDRLDKKYFKMLEQQSQLSQTPEGKLALESLGIFKSNKKIKSEICLLGYLFYPLEAQATGKPMLPPENSHPNHNKGFWLKLSQLEKLLPKDNDNLWKVIDKPFWMAPVNALRQQLSTREEILSSIKAHFSSSQRPLLISNFIERDKSHGANFESDEKYFVVSDNWPEKIKS